MLPYVIFQSISKARAVILESKGRMTMAQQELTEIRRREASDRGLRAKAAGVPYLARIRESHRCDWTKRYASAMAKDEKTEEAAQV